MSASVDEEAKQPAQTGWRLERDQLKTRLGAQEIAEKSLREEVALLERRRGEYLREIADLKYGSGRGKAGVEYDTGKLFLGTLFETDSMGQAVDASGELCKLMREFASQVEKGFEKEKDVGPERDAALRAIADVLAAAQAEQMAIAGLLNTKDKFSDVLKGFKNKIANEPE